MAATRARDDRAEAATARVCGELRHELNIGGARAGAGKLWRRPNRPEKPPPPSARAYVRADMLDLGTPELIRTVIGVQNRMLADLDRVEERVQAGEGRSTVERESSTWHGDDES